MKREDASELKVLQKHCGEAEQVINDITQMTEGHKHGENRRTHSQGN